MMSVLMLRLSRIVIDGVAYVKLYKKNHQVI